MLDRMLDATRQAEPDFGRLERVLRRDGVPDRVPVIELFHDTERQVLHRLGELRPRPSDEEVDWHLRQHILHQSLLGYDYLRVVPENFYFPQVELPRALTNEGWRHYHQADTQTIANRDDFERYRWPQVEDVDFRILDRAARWMPTGMKILSGVPGVLESVLQLLGYTGLSYLLADDEPLVQAMFAEVGTRVVAVAGQLAAHPAVGAVFMGDDLGFRTHTLISPAMLERYVLPHHRAVVAAVHAAGKPAILHSCGNLSGIMEAVIGCGWDAKHSFEDSIQPVWEAKAQYGDRIALLGGFDMDRLARSTPEAVQEHTRYLLQTCAPGGGYALGSGKSIASFVPVENYLAMLTAGQAAGWGCD